MFILNIYYFIGQRMAVPKRKTSKSKRNMRRAHDSLTKPHVTVNKTTGGYTLPHHISVDGYYGDRKVLKMNDKK